MMLKKRMFYLLIFIFCLPVLSFGEDVIPTTIFSGKICTKWKTSCNLPCSMNTTISSAEGTPIVLLKNSIFFKFGLIWRGENETRVSQKCTIIIHVEKEAYPDSDKWIPLFEKFVNVMSRQGEINEEFIATKDILQEKPEVKYRIIVQTTMPFGRRVKHSPTYITVRLAPWVYSTATATSIPPVFVAAATIPIVLPLPDEPNITAEQISPEIKEVLPEENPSIEEELPASSTISETNPQPEELLPAVEETVTLEKETHSLLTNGDFASGLSAWELVKTGRGKEMYARLITNDDTYPFAVEIKRSGSLYVKGEMGIKQVLNKDVSRYAQLFLKAEAKIIHSSLRSDGNQGGAYPISIRIDYLDVNNETYIWQQGFMYAPKINYLQIGMQIPQDIWYPYSTINLMELDPKPLVIKEIRLSGSGWRFYSRIANVELIGILP